MKILVFTLLLYLFSFFTHASDISCTVSSSVIDPSGEFSLRCPITLTTPRYRIRPEVSNGSILIENNGIWIWGTENWTRLPFMQTNPNNEYKLKLLPAEIERTSFSITLQDILSGTTTNFTPMILYGESYTKKYIKSLSETIESIEIASSAPLEEFTIPIVTQSTQSIVKSPFIFLVGIVVCGLGLYVNRTDDLAS